MSNDFLYFAKIQNRYGFKNHHEKELYKINYKMGKHFKDTIDTEDVLINDIEFKLMIIKTSNPYKKKIKSVHGYNIHRGDIVQWNNQLWLVTDVDPDEKVWFSGEMQFCNYMMRWQNDLGNIIERPIVFSNGVSSSKGVSETEVIKIGSDQKLVFLPYDNETKVVKRGKRFFVDNNIDDPMVYELTKPNRTDYVYNGHGYICWILSETQYTPTEQEKDLGICDYIEPLSPSPSPDEPQYNNLSCLIKYDSSILKVGSTNEYCAEFFDNDGNRVDNVLCEWNIISNFNNLIQYNIHGDKILISTIEDKLIDNSFMLKLNDSENKCSHEIEIYITGMY